MESIHLLLVEDNEGDILLTKEAFEESKIYNKISVVRNGKEALDFVFQRGKYKNELLPDIILLDVNLPLINGHEVLHAIKTNAKTMKIPVIMLTTSSSSRDIDLSYQYHANCYITKPVDVEGFIAAICTIEDFWIQLVKLPKKP